VGQHLSASSREFYMMRAPVPEERIVTRLILVLAVIAAASACGNDTAPTPPTSSGPYSQTDLVVGTGALAASGNQVTVNYTGWLYDTSRTDGKGTQFETGQFGPFRLGTGFVIAGWDRGVPGMRVGGQRRLVIPPELAYGSGGSPPKIPGNATLLFDVTLLSVQ
jgi:FKBP-type peptidyl-prolyl cis-trans isomerase FkpA